MAGPTKKGTTGGRQVSGVLDELIDAIDSEMASVKPDESGVQQKAAVPVDSAKTEQHIMFSLAGADYTFPIGNVLEVTRPPEVTPVPNVPDWVLGVSNLRGDVLSLVDLGHFFGLAHSRLDASARMLVLADVTKEITVGVVIDRVQGIRHIRTDRIGRPTAPLEGKVSQYLRGVYESDGKLLGILNCDSLLRSEDMRQFE